MFAIDCHDHVYNRRIAKHAVSGVGDFYNVEMNCTGIADELIGIAENSPIKHFVINAVALTPKHVNSLNNFIISECEKHKEFSGLATLHPDMENADEEIERVIAAGIKGIKLHPDTQNFNADCENAMKLYEKIAGRLPLLIHSGDYRYNMSHPERIAHIIDTFPNLTVVAAHLGGWSIYDEAVPYMLDRKCFMDISSVMPFMPPEKVLGFIKLYGADRLIFGSDFPMWNPIKEYESFMALELSDEERAKILWKNASNVFGIDFSEYES